MYTKSQQAIIDRVDSPFYVPLPTEGAPIHPGGWTVAEGIDYTAWYKKQIDAYCKYHYSGDWAK